MLERNVVPLTFLVLLVGFFWVNYQERAGRSLEPASTPAPTPIPVAAVDEPPPSTPSSKPRKRAATTVPERTRETDLWDCLVAQPSTAGPDLATRATVRYGRCPREVQALLQACLADCVVRGGDKVGECTNGCVSMPQLMAVLAEKACSEKSAKDRPKGTCPP